MKHFKLSEKQFCKLINEAAGDYEIYVPSSSDECFTWVKTTSIEQMVDADVLPTTSIKQFFFPNSEPLFEFEKVAQEVTLKDVLPATPRIVLGVHACDLGSLKVMEALFGDTCDDELYREKRNNTLVVGISCKKDDWACFCEQLDINAEFSPDGDLFISQKGEEYILSATSQAGGAFIEKYAKNLEHTDEFNPPTAITKEGKYQLDFPKLKNILDESFNSELWEKISRKCITCGICTYLCPTCHCFEIYDEERRGCGERSRCYDSCMYSHFTIMAGGYNPRSKKLARFRQRYMHKYNYFVHNFNQVACSGCGRCIRHCPVNVDVRQNLTLMQNTSAKNEGENE